MTKETSAPETLEAAIANASPSTTVFSDGSTFDYENGYKSNGAPIATRDRTENPTIVKSHKILTEDRVLSIIGWSTFFGVLAFAVLVSISNFQAAANWNALKAGVNDIGPVEVVEVSNGDLIVKSNEVMFKCDVSFVSNNGNPAGLVFCGQSEGDGPVPATFSIPLPHDPENLLYVAPAKDAKE